MRKQFYIYLKKLMEKDKDIVVLAGDLGYSYFEVVRDAFPGRLINCGIAEQAMVGIAAGLALSGKKPYCYSSAPFLIFRAFEQIRDDVCYQNLNVKFIGATSSFLGFTHNLCGTENEEDILKNLPNIKRYYPKTDPELEKNLLEAYNSTNPVYIRL